MGGRQTLRHCGNSPAPHAPEAIEELARLATKGRSEATRVSAIRELLDRGYGRPGPDSKVALEFPIDGSSGEGAEDNGGEIKIILVKSPKRDEHGNPI